MERGGESGRRTDRRVGLTPDRIIQVALRMSEGSGLNSWTVRDLAAELDVAPSVIYHHIGGRDLVIRGVVEQLVRSLRPPDPRLEWQEWFRAFLFGLRPVVAPYPGVAKWLLMHGPAFPGVARFFDAGIGALARAGFERPATLYSLLVNSAMLTVAMSDDRRETADDGPRHHAAMRRDFESLGTPSHGLNMMFQEMLIPLSEDREHAGEEVNLAYYELLVETLIRGLEAQLSD